MTKRAETSDLDQRLASLARATADIAPAATSDDALFARLAAEPSPSAEGLDARIASLGAATAELAPARDFADKLVARVARPALTAPSTIDGVARRGPWALAFAAAIAAASLGLWLETEEDLGAALVAGVDSMEVGE